MVLEGTLYIAAARCWLIDASDFMACIARIILSSQGSASRSGCYGIMIDGGWWKGLGKGDPFSGVIRSVVGHVIIVPRKQDYPIE